MAVRLTGEIAALAASLPAGQLDIPQLHLARDESFATEARLNTFPAFARIAIALKLAQVPLLVHADPPFEIVFDICGEDPAYRYNASAGIARLISEHGRIVIAVKTDTEGAHFAPLSVPISVCPSKGFWTLRALISPRTWAGSSAISVVSIALAGQPLQCGRLPLCLRVGYSHIPSPAGSVLAAAKAGDVPALQDALDAGGSTEEADKVLLWASAGACSWRVYCLGSGGSFPLTCWTYCIFSHLQIGGTALFWAARLGRLEALRMLLVAGANPADKNEVCKDTTVGSASLGSLCASSLRSYSGPHHWKSYNPPRCCRDSDASSPPPCPFPCSCSIAGPLCMRRLAMATSP